MVKSVLWRTKLEGNVQIGIKPLRIVRVGQADCREISAGAQALWKEMAKKVLAIQGNGPVCFVVRDGT